MSDQKTTVYLDTAEYRKLQGIARREGRSAAELIREAVAEYTARRAGVDMPRSLGAARSGQEDLAERADELLEGLGEGR